MNDSRRILIFPGGTEIGLELNRALSTCRGVRLYSAGSGISNHAPFVFERHFVVPSVHEVGWIDAINAIARSERIQYVFPAHDDVVLALARQREELVPSPLCPPVATCSISRSKRLTYQELAGVVRVPRLYDPRDPALAFPLFVKPDCGQGSQGASHVGSRAEMEAALARIRDGLVCELLPGPEFTVDCFSDRDRGLLFCSGRQRVRVRNGISVATRIVDDPRFLEMACAISSRLVLFGAWFFQVKESYDGELTLLEVAPRIAGAMALNRVRGVNFAWLTIMEAERVPLTVMVNANQVQLDRALINRYRHDLEYDAVYIDFDDTLVINGRVHPPLIRFVFQCIGRGIRVVLITRHAGDLDQALRQFRLAGLFDEVIRLKEGEPKSANIDRSGRPIFVDDSFSERSEVAKSLGIPTFDAGMVEMLIDERV